MSAIEEVKSRLDIVEVIGERVPLKRAGRNYKGLCPFHQERTPSFFVFPESQHYHCFGCGAGGDVFTFIMQLDRLEFSEALATLARRAGVMLRPPTPQEQEADRTRRRLLEIHREAARFFQEQLQSPAGATVRAYLDRRGIRPETVQAFLLGYAPDRWEALSAHLRGCGYTESELRMAGLVVEREGGTGSYDRFRQRLIFPIRDLQGNVVGFGGRALDETQQPKYLNSPQTPIFDKGALLYGLDQADAAIRREGRAILVEGYFDVLMAHQEGYKNVVAPMGTSLTAAQVRLLKRMTRRLYLAMDADEAGAMAVRRDLEVIREAMDERLVPVPTAQGLVRFERELDGEVRIVVLPAGRDPDEVILADRETWERCLEQALPVLDFVLEQIAREAHLETARGKREAVQQALPLLSEVHNPVEQAHYVQRLAHLLQVDERAIASELRRAAHTSSKPVPRPTGRERGGEIPPAEDQGAPLSLLGIRREEVVEGYFLALLYRFPALWEYLPVGVDALLSQEEHRVLLGMLPANPSDLEPELRRYLEDLLARFQGQGIALPLPSDEDTARRALQDCLQRLRALANERQRREYAEVLAQAQEEGNQELAQEVFRQLSVLSQHRWEIAMPPPRRLFPDARRYLSDEEGPATGRARGETR